MSECLILQMERDALDRSDKGDAGGFLEISDPEVVYIDPAVEKPIRGVDALREYYKGFGGGEPCAGEMLNPNVQVAGDAAVLTFSYVSRGLKTGRVVCWNATEVYRCTKAGRRIIHTHWPFLKPQLAQ
jgi:hypothetical protein